MINVDLNLLAAFDALMSERNVTRAAQRLSIGQPAMSAALGRLRKLFDDPLLVREGRTMQPTPLAESLAEPIHRALATLEEAVSRRPLFEPATDHRTFSITASDYVAMVFLRPLLARLALTAPNVRIHVHPVQPDSMERLSSGKDDLLIAPREALADVLSVETVPLFEDRYVCAVAADNPLVGDSITVEQFGSVPYLASHSGPIRATVDDQLDLLGIARQLEISTRTFLLAPLLLPGSSLLTMVHERLGHLVRDEFNLPIRLIEPPVELQPITELMAWTAQHSHDEGNRWLRTQMHGLASEL